jgi:hypothetical protein
MRRAIITAAVVLIVLSLGFLWLNQSPLSSEQKNTVKLLGYPADFVITYLPRKEGDQLVRSEVWYYPDIGKQISFLGGKLAGAQAYSTTEKLKPTTLKPEMFDFDSQFSDLEDSLGKANIDPVDYLEGFTADNLKTYFSDQAVFIFENDQLIYFQTVGVSDLPQPAI